MFFKRILAIKIQLFFQQGIGDLIFIEYKFYGIGMRMNGNMVVFQYCVE